MQPRFLFLSLLCLLLTVAPVRAETLPAQEVVRTTADQVLVRLKADREQLKAQPELIYDLVNELIIPHFDFYSMSKWVLGQNWRSANEAQREQFTNEFRTLLVRTYAKALLEYSDNPIIYLPVHSNPDSNLVEIRTEIEQTGSSKVPINYNMHISGGDWKVVDVSINGISIVSTYRGSFASEIRNGGIDGLIAKLVDKNKNITGSQAKAVQ